MTTPHRVGQVAKAEILVAHLLDTAPADADHQRCAQAIVAQLQTELGWSPPRDLTAVPPLRPEHVATEAQREAAMARIRGIFASSPSSSTGHNDQQRGTLTPSAEAPADTEQEVNA